MSIQKSLIDKCKIENVLKPKTNSQWQLFRGEEVAGSGTYHVMNKDGVVEDVAHSEEITQTILDNINASVVESQEDAVLLTANFNRITESVENGSVILLPSFFGSSQTVYNSSPNDVLIYPAVGEDLGNGVNMSISIGLDISHSFESAYYSIVHSVYG